MLIAEVVLVAVAAVAYYANALVVFYVAALLAAFILALRIFAQTLFLRAALASGYLERRYGDADSGADTSGVSRVLSHLRARHSLKVAVSLRRIRLRCVQLSQAGLDFISSKLALTMPLKMTLVRVAAVDVTLSWKVDPRDILDRSWGRLLPRLTVELSGVRVTLERTEEADWEAFKAAMLAQAVQKRRGMLETISAIAEERFWNRAPAREDVLIDDVIGRATVKLRDAHVRIVDRANHKSAGLRIGLLEAVPGRASQDTLGATPRSVRLEWLDIYHDMQQDSGPSLIPCAADHVSGAGAQEESAASAGRDEAGAKHGGARAGAANVAAAATAIALGGSSGGGGGEPITGCLLENHDSAVTVKSGRWVVELPDMLSVALMPGRTKNGKSKRLRLSLESTEGISVKLEPTQTSSLLGDVLDCLTGGGAFRQWRLGIVADVLAQVLHAYPTEEEARAYMKAYGPTAAVAAALRGHAAAGREAVLKTTEERIPIHVCVLMRAHARNWQRQPPPALEYKARALVERCMRTVRTYNAESRLSSPFAAAAPGSDPGAARAVATAASPPLDLDRPADGGNPSSADDPSGPAAPFESGATGAGANANAWRPKWGEAELRSLEGLLCFAAQGLMNAENEMGVFWEVRVSANVQDVLVEMYTADRPRGGGLSGSGRSRHGSLSLRPRVGSEASGASAGSGAASLWRRAALASRRESDDSGHGAAGGASASVSPGSLPNACLESAIRVPRVRFDFCMLMGSALVSEPEAATAGGQRPAAASDEPPNAAPGVLVSRKGARRVPAGADGRAESLDESGPAAMTLTVELQQPSIVDYRGLEAGVMFPSLLDGDTLSGSGSGSVGPRNSAAAAAAAGGGTGGSGDAGALGGVISLDYGAFSWGYMVVDTRVRDVRLTALPERFLPLLDFVLRCFVPQAPVQKPGGAPTQRQASEESDSDSDDDEEEAMDEDRALPPAAMPFSRYLLLGSLNMRIRADLEGVEVFLLQDVHSASANMLMAKISAFLDAHSGNKDENVALDVRKLILMPCITNQGSEGVQRTRCRLLRAAAKAVTRPRPAASQTGSAAALEGDSAAAGRAMLLNARKELNAGFQYRLLGTMPVGWRPILRPVRLYLRYSTVTKHVGEAAKNVDADDGGEGARPMSPVNLKSKPQLLTMPSLPQPAPAAPADSGSATATDRSPDAFNAPEDGGDAGSVGGSVGSYVTAAGANDAGAGATSAPSSSSLVPLKPSGCAYAPAEALAEGGGGGAAGSSSVNVLGASTDSGGRVLSGSGKGQGDAYYGELVVTVVEAIRREERESVAAAAGPANPHDAVSYLFRGGGTGPAGGGSVARVVVGDASRTSPPAQVAGSGALTFDAAMAFVASRGDAEFVTIELLVGTGGGRVVASAACHPFDPDENYKDGLALVDPSGHVIGTLRVELRWRPRQLLIAITKIKNAAGTAQKTPMDWGVALSATVGEGAAMEAARTKFVRAPEGSTAAVFNEGLLFKCNEPKPRVELTLVREGDASVGRQEETIGRVRHRFRGPRQHLLAYTVLKDSKGTPRARVKVAFMLVNVNASGDVAPPAHGDYVELPRAALSTLFVSHGAPSQGGALSVTTEVVTDLTLHVPRGLQLQATELDVEVLLAVANGISAGLAGGVAAGAASAAGGTSGGALAGGVDGGMQAQQDASELAATRRSVVRLMRKAFRRADVDGNGELDVAEITELFKSTLGGGNNPVPEEEVDTGVQRLLALIDEDGSSTFNLEEFTSVMEKLVNAQIDSSAIVNARRRALVQAFREADHDGSGTLEPGEVRSLLRSLARQNTESEVSREVERFFEVADEDGSRSVDEEEFVRLAEVMSRGNPHEGPVEARAREYTGTAVIKGMLGRARSLASLLAVEDVTFQPPGFWELMEKEAHQPRGGKLDMQPVQALQIKMVKVFRNYEFAREAWGLLVLPAFVPGLPRVGAISAKAANFSSGSHYLQMTPPAATEQPVYITRDRDGEERMDGGGASLVFIHRLPSELQSEPLTGIRTSERDRNSREPHFLSFTVSCACTVHVCYDVAGGRSAFAPEWLAMRGFSRPWNQVHCSGVSYRIYSKSVPAGRVVLGGNEGAERMYFVLISGPGTMTRVAEGAVARQRRRAMEEALGEAAGQLQPPSDAAEAANLPSGPQQAAVVANATAAAATAAAVAPPWALTPNSAIGRSSALTAIGERMEASARAMTATAKRLAAAAFEREMRREAAAAAASDDYSMRLRVRAGILVENGIRMRLFDLHHLQNAAARLVRPQLELGVLEPPTVPPRPPVVRRCVKPGCPKLTFSLEAAEARRHSIKTLRSGSGGGSGAGAEAGEHAFSLPFCSEHVPYCRQKGCDRPATHAAEGDAAPLWCYIHCGRAMVPFEGPEPSDLGGGGGFSPPLSPDASPTNRGDAFDFNESSRGHRKRKPPPTNKVAPVALEAFAVFEHVSSEPLLGTNDDMAAYFATGLYGTYYNSRVAGSEYFLEPYVLACDAGMKRGNAEVVVRLNAQRHLTCNLTTAFTQTLRSIRRLILLEEPTPALPTAIASAGSGAREEAAAPLPTLGENAAAEAEHPGSAESQLSSEGLSFPGAASVATVAAVGSHTARSWRLAAKSYNMLNCYTSGRQRLGPERRLRVLNQLGVDVDIVVGIVTSQDSANPRGGDASAPRGRAVRTLSPPRGRGDGKQTEKGHTHGWRRHREDRKHRSDARDTPDQAPERSQSLGTGFRRRRSRLGPEWIPAGPGVHVAAAAGPGGRGVVLVPDIDAVATNVLTISVAGYEPIENVTLDFLNEVPQLFPIRRLSRKAAAAARTAAAAAERDDDSTATGNGGNARAVTWVENSTSVDSSGASGAPGWLPTNSSVSTPNDGDHDMDDTMDLPLLEFVALVVAFDVTPTVEAATLDVTLRLSTNVALCNMTLAPIRAVLSESLGPYVGTNESGATYGSPTGSDDGGATSLMPLAEAALPLPVLARRFLQVEGESTFAFNEPLPLLPVMFDPQRSARERHTRQMLLNCVSVDFTDPSTLTGMGAGDNAFSSLLLWKLHVIPPYVLSNDMPCLMEVELSQSEKPPVAQSGLRQRFSKFAARSMSNLVRRRKSLKDSGSGRASEGGSPAKSSASPSPNVSDAEDALSGNEASGGSARGSPASGAATSGAVGGSNASAVASRKRWVLQPGERRQVLRLDMKRPLHVRVRFVGVEQQCWSDAYTVEAKLHADRRRFFKKRSGAVTFDSARRSGALVELGYAGGTAYGAGGASFGAVKGSDDGDSATKSPESRALTVAGDAADPSFGAPDGWPQFKMGLHWESYSGTRSIHVYSKVWVVNKTGVALAYRAPYRGSKKGERAEPSCPRALDDAATTTDGQRLSFFRSMGLQSSAAAGKGNTNAGGPGFGVQAPVLLNCPAKVLQAMPYAMAPRAADELLYLGDVHFTSGSDFFCVTFEPSLGESESGSTAAGGANVPEFSPATNASSALPAPSSDASSEERPLPALAEDKPQATFSDMPAPTAATEIAAGSAVGEGGGKGSSRTFFGRSPNQKQNQKASGPIAAALNIGSIFNASVGAAAAAEGAAEFQIYADLPDLTLRLPAEIVGTGRRRVHLLTSHADRGWGLADLMRFRSQAASDATDFCHFVPSRDCYVYLGVDMRLPSRKGALPEWLHIVGFELASHLPPVAPTKGHTDIPGFVFYRRFFKGGTCVALGVNMSDAGAWKGGSSASNDAGPAQYFVVVVEAPLDHREVDVGPVHPDRDVGDQLSCHAHWYLRPRFHPMDPIYSDREHYTITELPDRYRRRRLMLVAPAQSDKNSSGGTHFTFWLFQESVVLVCVDQRAKVAPTWLAELGFAWETGASCPGQDGKSLPYTYNIWRRTYPRGPVTLYGNKSKGADRMYFALVYALADDDGPGGGGGGAGTDVRLPPSLSQQRQQQQQQQQQQQEQQEQQQLQGAGGEFVTPFWDEEKHGELLQMPLALDWQGRDWCKSFSTDAVSSVGQLETSASVFGVAISPMPGSFAKTRMVEIFPRFIVRNFTGVPLLVVPCLEDRDTFLRAATASEGGATYGLRSEAVFSALSQRSASAFEGDKSASSSSSAAPASTPNPGALEPQTAPEAERKTLTVVPDRRCVALYGFFDLSRLPANRDGAGGDVGAMLEEMGGGGSDSASPNRKGRDREKEKERGANKARCIRLEAVAEDGKEDMEAEMTGPLFVESIGEGAYVWLRRGGLRDVLVRCFCHLLPNGCTVAVSLTDATDAPPLRIENRSSSLGITYRVAGCAERLALEPMRWNAFVWSNDDQWVDVGFLDKRQQTDQKLREVSALVFGSRARAMVKNRHSSGLKDKGETSTSSRMRDAVSNAKEATSRALQLGQGSRDREGRDDGVKVVRYTPDKVGKLPDLSVGGLRLKAECQRRRGNVTTLVLVFSDRDGEEAAALGAGDPAVPHSAAMDELRARLAHRLEQNMQMQVALAGVAVNLVDSTSRGPVEVASVCADDLLLVKEAGSARMVACLWHLQVDDMIRGSQYPTILRPLRTGFNSHLADSLVPAPLLRIEFERDVEASLMHGIICFRDLRVSVDRIRCTVFLDYWVDLQLLIQRSLNWSYEGEEAVRRHAVETVHAQLLATLDMPTEGDIAGNVFFQNYLQGPLTLQVEFHLGQKMLPMLGRSSGGDLDADAPDLAPATAMGGVMWALVTQVGNSVANASPTFVFQPIEVSNYYGTNADFLQMLLRSLTTQTVSQVLKVLGHIEILGDPMSLGKGLGGGVIKWVTKTTKGHGVEGARDLLKGVVGAPAGSASKMTNAIDEMMKDALDLEKGEDFLARVGVGANSTEEERQGPRHLGTGVTDGAMYFGRALARGVTGVVYEPYRGAKKEGGVGFVKGLGRGIVGLAAAPVSGALGATSKITSGIEATTRLLDDQPMARRRPARDGSASEGRLVPLTRDVFDENVQAKYWTIYDEWLAADAPPEAELRPAVSTLHPPGKHRRQSNSDTTTPSGAATAAANAAAAAVTGVADGMRSAAGLTVAEDTDSVAFGEEGGGGKGGSGAAGADEGSDEEQGSWGEAGLSRRKRFGRKFKEAVRKVHHPHQKK